MDLTSTPPPNHCIKSSNLSQSKFLQLPTEVRCIIYSFCLISPFPIIVWRGKRPHTRTDILPSLERDRQTTLSSTQNLALGLLRCSTTVATESAQIFYSKNSFRFQRAHQSHVIAWLIKVDGN
ncbi:MAG: hypothetical protein LQ349_005897, partial [Xanthoria aureola]